MNDRRRTWKELLLEQAIQGFGISWWRADVVVGEGGKIREEDATLETVHTHRFTNKS